MVNKKILFRFEASIELGMGHVFRSVELIKLLQDYECIAVISDKSVLAHDVLRQNKILYEVIHSNEDLIQIIKNQNFNIIVNDILDTDIKYINQLKALGCRVVNLEDEGTGANLADVVINELYERSNDNDNEFYGHLYCCLPKAIAELDKNQFHKDIKELIMLFGCTDPSNLSMKTLSVLNNVEGLHNIHITVIIGPGNNRADDIEAMKNRCRYRNNIEIVRNADLSRIMQNADIAICSQGRTIFELAHLAVPTIIMAQNKREQMHTFALLKNGFINLGLGTDVSECCLKCAIELLLKSLNLRKEMYESMLNMNLETGREKIKKLILGEQNGLL